MRYPNRKPTSIKSLSHLTLAITAVLAIPEFGSAVQVVPQPEEMRVADGFSVELVYDVPEKYGSWVSLTTSPQGLITSDQYGKLYVIQPGKNPDETEVRGIDLPLGHAQGLLWAFDSLYVVAHGSKQNPAGLYRVTDSDDDGQLDHYDLLRKLEGGGEHGPHAVILGPDGKSLYVCAGNHTKLPEIDASRVPQTWQEDKLLPRMWDPNGHAVGIKAPGGWVCKTDPEGKSWELISIGFRNQYDIAFDTNGELFTYDADMEWDIGTPWYRPTRVCHVTPGSEFGWRGGDAKWPVYYPDSVPPVIDIGPGSPTGVVFGTGTQFPLKYQRALFIADWSFGFIYAIHLTPDGGTWTAEKELFCSAPALQVTDLTVHEGELYFAIGGRRTQSALYRISADQPNPTSIQITGLTADQNLRRSIENRQFGGTPVVDAVWPHLSHPDRSIRYAARIVLEQTPLQQWKERALAERDPQAMLEALLALTRSHPLSTADQHQIVKVTAEQLDWDELTHQQRLHLLRLFGLVLMRSNSKETEPSVFESINLLIADHYPSDHSRVNRELCRLLVATSAENVVPKTIDLMEQADTQEDQIHYVMCIRHAEDGWTTGLRRRYLNWFTQSALFQGGKSFSRYLQNARQEFIEKLPEDEREKLANLIETPTENKDPYAVLKAREVVKDWTMSDLVPALLEADLSNRDLKNGRQVFATAQCYKCHRFQGNGGMVGPDLTGLSRRYTSQYLLETLLEPSKQISDQYQATIFELDNGKMVVGRVANLSNNVYMVQEDMISPGNLTNINREQIVDRRPSTVSPMPEGLLDTFTKDDILDLMAYLRSGEVVSPQ